MLTLRDDFAGWGGTTQGAALVPGVLPTDAANHDPLAVDVHGMNFPNVDHFLGNLQDYDMTKFPRADLYTASPACPAWTLANGKKVEFDQANANQTAIPGMEAAQDFQAARSRALMNEIPRYLAAMARKGEPVLAGMVENVVQCRRWADWRRWIHEIETAAPQGYEVMVLTMNSMHVRPVRAAWAPQSRERMIVLYYLRAFGRRPDVDKWLRPDAYCPRCDRMVPAVKSWKKPGPPDQVGRYGIKSGQYVYRCPAATCRGYVVEPVTRPAMSILDLSDVGERIGDKPIKDFYNRTGVYLGTGHLAPATIARIEAGIDRYWRRTTPDLPTPDNPLVIPYYGADTTANTAADPLRTLTTNDRFGLAFMAELRGGSSDARKLTDPLATVTASGNHHMLVRHYSTPPATDPGYLSTPVSEPMGTLTTSVQQSLATFGRDFDVLDCWVRMLNAAEVRDGMAFDPAYKVKGTREQQIKGYGNAVTPPVSEISVSMLVEVITGEQLERSVT